MKIDIFVWPLIVLNSFMNFLILVSIRWNLDWKELHGLQEPERTELIVLER